MGDDEGKLEDHEESVRCHPHGRDQGEVMQEGRCHHTDLKCLHLVDTDRKEHQHQNHGSAELQSELSVVSLPKLSARGKREEGGGEEEGGGGRDGKLR